MTLFYGFLAVFAFMTLLWLIHFPIKNAAIVDVGWTFSLLLLTALYFIWAKQTGAVQILLLVMVGLWACRLGLYLFFTRVLGAQEEGRYVALRESWKTQIGLKFFIFFQAQGLLDIVLSIPFLLVMREGLDHFHFLHYVGAAVFFTGWIGETLSDWQLHTFKKNNQKKGQVCQIGLWKYSRHPNYFFELLVWLGFALYALPSPMGYLGFLSPLLIGYFIFKITGIPATEEQALRSKGEAYAEYQRTTSRFVPWFPKRDSEDSTR